MRQSIILAAAMIAALPLTALGSITADTGAAVRIDPPVSVRERTAVDTTGLASSTRFVGFQEGVDFALERDLDLDIKVTADGTWTSFPGVQAALTSPTIVRSYLVHAQRKAGESADVTLTGIFTFDEPIIGIIARKDNLVDSDFLRAEGTLYPDPSATNRGLELGASADRIRIANGRTRLEFRLRFDDSLDQVRVITASPHACDWVDAPNSHTTHTATGDEDVLCGLDGQDILRGIAGEQVILGGTGSDVLLGRAGDDLLYGGPSDDGLYPHGGDDEVDGGLGNDDVYFDGSGDGATCPEAPTGCDPAAVRVDLTTGRATATTKTGGVHDAHPQFGRDRLSGIERVWGTNRADVLIGSAGNEDFFGRGGNDRIFGRGGDDVLQGDNPYCFDDANTDDSTAPGTWACEGDGPGGYDVPNGDDRLYGESGDDRLFGGLGADFMDGGPGVADIVSFDATSDPLERDVTLDLRVTGGQGTGHGSDTIVRVESAFGSLGDDHLIGTAAANLLIGGPGADVLDGLGEGDVLIGGYPAYYYGPPRSDSESDDEADVLHGRAGDDTLMTTNDEGTADTLDAGPGGFDVCYFFDIDTLVACEMPTDESGAITTRLRRRPVAEPAAASFSVGPTDVRKSVTGYDRELGKVTTYAFVISKLKTRSIDVYTGSDDYAASQICRRFNDFSGYRYTMDMGDAKAACQASVTRFWTYWKKLIDGAAGASDCAEATWSAGGYFRFDATDDRRCVMR